MSDTLQQAIQAIEGGNPKAAIRPLSELLRANPRNEEAWLWMAQAVPNPQHKIDCLERLLKLNPNHSVARAMLEELRPKPAPQPEVILPPELLELEEPPEPEEEVVPVEAEAANLPSNLALEEPLPNEIGLPEASADVESEPDLRPLAAEAFPTSLDLEEELLEVELNEFDLRNEEPTEQPFSQLDAPFQLYQQPPAEEKPSIWEVPPPEEEAVPPTRRPDSAPLPPLPQKREGTAVLVPKHMWLNPKSERDKVIILDKDAIILATPNVTEMVKLEEALRHKQPYQELLENRVQHILFSDIEAIQAPGKSRELNVLIGRRRHPLSFVSERERDRFVQTIHALLGSSFGYQNKRTGWLMTLGAIGFLMLVCIASTIMLYGITGTETIPDPTAEPELSFSFLSPNLVLIAGVFGFLLLAVYFFQKYANPPATILKRKK